MRTLLDTHVLLWALMEPGRLSPRARRVVENLDNEVLVSSASAWEIATKHRLGRLPEAESVIHGYPEHVTRLQATDLPISSRHALLAGALPGSHRDPFDRMLAAQGLIEGIPVITSDPVFKHFRVKVLW